MSNFLITGGAGFIGSSLAEKLSADSKNEVVIVDSMLTGNAANLPTAPNVNFIKCDVNDFADISAVFYGRKFDYIYHYAAVVGVARTLENPILVLKDIDGIRNILDLAKSTGTKKVFFSSSSEVYGEPVELPQHEETTPLNSRLPYAVVKNIGESYFKSYQQEFGLEYTIFRFFNTYGPKQSTDFVMSKFLLAAMNNQDITIYGDGSQTRTFCYVDDNTAATIACIDSPDMKNAVVNIGNDQEITIKQLAEIIIKLTGSTSKIVNLPPLKEGDMTRRQPDAGKMRQLVPQLTSLEDGIAKLIEHRRLVTPKG